MEDLAKKSGKTKTKKPRKKVKLKKPKENLQPKEYLAADLKRKNLPQEKPLDLSKPQPAWILENRQEIGKTKLVPAEKQYKLKALVERSINKDKKGIFLYYMLESKLYHIIYIYIYIYILMLLF